jgi:hypothetical protein
MLAGLAGAAFPILLFEREKSLDRCRVFTRAENQRPTLAKTPA